MSDVLFAPVRELGRRLRAREFSAADLVDAFLRQIDRLNPELNAFITVTADAARARARRLDDDLRAGRDHGPLHGIPYAVKDIVATRGVRTTNASKVTADRVPDYDATLVERLDAAGAILLGKLNLREFATGSGILSGFGTVKNPWGLEFTAAGSSSGSGAAVAAGMVPLTIGTDTGGSIRGPAAVCGIVGLKPTYGRVSLHGVTPLSWSMDHAGPMTRRVEDTALMLRAIAGADPRDALASPVPPADYLAGLDAGIAGLRLGVPVRHFTEGAHPDVEAAWQAALRTFEVLGARLVDVDVPHADLAPAAGGLISMTEAATYHEKRLRESPELFDPLVRERLQAAGFYLATDYVKAQRLRTVLVSEVNAAFERCDAIVVPAYPRLPARVETAETAGSDVKPGAEAGPYRASNAYIANMTGIPALVVPCGFSSGRPPLPIALQLYGGAFDEATILRIGHAYQKVTDWHTRTPPMATPA